MDFRQNTDVQRRENLVFGKTHKGEGKTFSHVHHCREDKPVLSLEGSVVISTNGLNAQTLLPSRATNRNLFYGIICKDVYYLCSIAWTKSWAKPNDDTCVKWNITRPFTKNEVRLYVTLRQDC